MNILIEQPDESMIDKANIIGLCDKVIASEIQDKEVELQIEFVDEPAMRELNNKYRNVDLPTDVLSLPVFNNKEEIQNDPSDMILLGNIFICEIYIARNNLDKTGAMNHINLAIVHGILHCLGYTHDTDEEEVKMNEIENKYLTDQKEDNS